MKEMLLIVLLLLITKSSLGSMDLLSGSGDSSGDDIDCSIRPDCRPSLQMNRPVMALSDMNLILSQCERDRPVNSLQVYRNSISDPFEYGYEMNELKPNGVTGIVVRINDTSTGRISYRVINQIRIFNLHEFACTEVTLSYAWIISNTTICLDFSPSINLCLESEVPSHPTDIRYTVMGGTNCTRTGVALITIDWKPPNDTINLLHYRLNVMSTTNSTVCQTRPYTATLNKMISSAVIQVTESSNLPLYGCNYMIALSSYPGGHYSQIQVQPTLPMPNLTSVCSSVFDTDTQLYNVTIRWEVNPNDCSVGSYLTSFVLKMLPFEKRFGLIQIIDSRQVQAEVEPDTILPRVYEYTFSQNPPRRTGQGYTVEIQPKFRNIADVPGSWSSRLSQRECPALTPPIPPEQMNFINVTNFTLYNRRASLNLEWSPPYPSNGDIVEYQIWIWSQISNDRVQTLNRVNSITNNTLEMRVNFNLPDVYSTFNVQMRASNHWCLLEFNKCYSNWSTPIVVPASSAIIPTVSSVITPMDPTQEEVSSIVLWSVVIGVIVGLIIIILILLVITVCCCHCGGRCLKRNYSMSPFIDVDTGLNDMLKFPNLNDSIPIDSWEIPRNLLEVHIDDKLGSGCFGEVCKGSLKMSHVLHNKKHYSHLLHQRRGSSDLLPVAVKKLKSTADGKERSDFLKEIEIMKTVSSTDSDLKRFVVNMLGCCQMEEPILLVIEFVKYGDLLNYLRKMKRKTEVAKSQGIQIPVPYLEPAGTYSQLDPKKRIDDEGFLTERNLLDFGRQIASGMEYLASLGIVHRDLACRNILVSNDKNLKISDFGLSRIVLQDMVYTLTNHGRLPLRWMALESIFQREFTSSSDVWSYGIVLWEICTMGMYPYSALQEKELLKLLKKGYRLPKPQNCSQEMFEVMHQCWHPHPNGRPSFPKLHKIFDYFLSRHTQELYPYIDMDATAPYTYDHLTHMDISDYKRQEILTLTDDENCGYAADESSGYGSAKDLQILSSDEADEEQRYLKENLTNSESPSQEDSIHYDKLRAPSTSGEHPFLVRLSNNGPLDCNFIYDGDYWEEGYEEDEEDDEYLHPFDVYRMKKLSTITEVSFEDYGHEDNSRL